jgi:ubiquinone/menaquinone biosynthesis C-methylase UbiE
MNEKAHWDKIATRYNEEIFDVFKSDRDKRLAHYFRKHSNVKHDAIDFGCGTGKAFQYLSPAFKTVHAIDISSQCLITAKKRAFPNITFGRQDLSRQNLRLPSVDFVFCCNVIMLPEIGKNQIMFNNIHRCLRKNGSALIVIPSLESIMFSSWRLIDWYGQEGVSPEEIPASELAYFKGNKKDILQGIIYIDGVATKHYSQSEIEVLIERSNLELTAVEKLEYDWDSEFAAPPMWMRSPYPWDWLVECKRVK